MTTPRREYTRPRYIARWLTGAGIPSLREDGTRIVGLSGVTITVGSARNRKGTLTRELALLSWADRRRIHVVPSQGGADIQDSVAMIRLDFLTELLVPYVEANRDRLYGKE